MTLGKRPNPYIDKEFEILSSGNLQDPRLTSTLRVVAVRLELIAHLPFEGFSVPGQKLRGPGLQAGGDARPRPSRSRRLHCPALILLPTPTQSQGHDAVPATLLQRL